MKRIIAVFLLISLLTAGLCGCSAGGPVQQIISKTSGFETNDFSLPESRLNVPDALDVYGGEDIGFSFLYPYGMEVSWNEEDGACISYEDGQIPYVLINKTDKKGMTPEKYFHASDKQILKRFDKVQSSTIHEVPLEEKTLYMTRYQCTEGDSQVYIDRYIEIYPDCYIQYTAITNTADEMNTAVYYASTTLSPEAGCYLGEYSEEFVTFIQGDTGISIQLPKMLDTKELTIGYLATSNDALLLAVVCVEDDDGNPIYNRQNFMDRASENPDFVASYIGADSTTFGSGTKKMINGKEFYAYPMTMRTADECYSGAIYLANADENGCVMVCYAVKDESSRFDPLSELCLKSVDTFEYKY